MLQNEKRFASMAREKLRLKMRSREEGTAARLLLASPCWVHNAGSGTTAGPVQYTVGGTSGHDERMPKRPARAMMPVTVHTTEW